MPYSKKQKLFADFMLKKIGIENQEIIDKYLSHLESIYGKWAGNYFEVSGCIDALIQEIELKKNTENIITKPINKNYSATDLSNYTYCPASYVINNSFEITKPSGEENTETGKKFHEQLRLLNMFKREANLSFDSNYVIRDNDELRKINFAENIFCGHLEELKFFSNGEFTGVPDYIFQDLEGKYFVVEEKFQRKRDPSKLSYNEMWAYNMGHSFDDDDAEKARIEWENFQPYFFDNHIVQTVAYIKNILEYQISYGYLIYWYYDITNGEAYVHKVTTKKIELNDYYEQLYTKALKGITEIQNECTQAFQIQNLNTKKCAGCVVNKYCGHKNQKFSDLSFPYNKAYLKLYFVKFPDELRKEPVVDTIAPTPIRDSNSFTIDQIKDKLGFTKLVMIRQLNKEGKETEWVSHWDNERRIRVTMNEIVLKKLLDNRNIDTLQIEKTEVAATETRKEYVQYLIVDKSEKNIIN